MRDRATVRSVAEAELWTAFAKASLGALGLAMLATGSLVPRPEAFPALRTYVLVAGAALVLVAATARHRPVLTVLGCIALSAGLAASLVGDAQPMASRAALALDCGAAILLGAVARRPWMALPFLLVPILVVAAGPPGWEDGHTGFAAAWETAMGCGCLWPGVPAALALAGAALGDQSVRPWPVVRPSAFLVLVASGGVLVAGLVLASVTPDAWATARTWLGRVALAAGLLAWVALAYEAGRRAFVWQAAIAGLLVLVGQVYADADIDPIVFDGALLANVLASLFPGLLAAIGLLVRQWVGDERPTGAGPDPLGPRAFADDMAKGTHVETRQPLHVGGFGARDRPDDFGEGGAGRSDRGNE